MTNLEYRVKDFSPASYLPVLGENETFNNDNDVSGIKSFFSSITDFQKKKKKNSILAVILLFSFFFYSLENFSQPSYLFNFLDSRKRIIASEIEISFENSFNVKPEITPFAFLKVVLEFIKSKNITDLCWINIGHCLFLNNEIIVDTMHNCSILFQFIFFTSFYAMEYLLDLTIIEHSITIEKNLLDFSTDLFGFYQNIRSNSGCSLSVVDSISMIYFHSLVPLKFKVRYEEEKNFLNLKASKKTIYSKNQKIVASKSFFDLNKKFSKINFHIINPSTKKNFLKKVFTPNYLMFRFKKIPVLFNPFSYLGEKSISVNDMIKQFIGYYWHSDFFLHKSLFHNLPISIFLEKLIFEEKNFSNSKILIVLIRIFQILKIKSTLKYLKNLVVKTLEKERLLNYIFISRLFHLYLIIYIEHFDSNLEKKAIILKNDKKYESINGYLKILKLTMKNLNRLSRNKLLKEKENYFSIKKSKLFSIVNLINESTKNQNLNYRTEEGINNAVFKFTGCIGIISLLINLLSIFKIKALFGYIIEILRKKSHKLSNMIKNKADRFILLKILLKSNLRRLKMSKIGVLENLIPFRMINVNYLPRAIFEKKLVKNSLLNPNLEILFFFYFRIMDWKRTTRLDKNSLQHFFKFSQKKEQKIAIKTLCKVKEAKNLFNSGIANFSVNSLESTSFFITMRMSILLRQKYLENKKTAPRLDFIDIIYLGIFFKMYMKKIKF